MLYDHYVRRSFNNFIENELPPSALSVAEAISVREGIEDFRFASTLTEHRQMLQDNAWLFLNPGNEEEVIVVGKDTPMDIMEFACLAVACRKTIPWERFADVVEQQYSYVTNKEKGEEMRNKFMSLQDYLLGK